jgi:hypothetical protein
MGFYIGDIANTCIIDCIFVLLTSVAACRSFVAQFISDVFTYIYTLAETMGNQHQAIDLSSLSPGG